MSAAALPASLIFVSVFAITATMWSSSCTLSIVDVSWVCRNVRHTASSKVCTSGSVPSPALVTIVHARSTVAGSMPSADEDRPQLGSVPELLVAPPREVAGPPLGIRRPRHDPPPQVVRASGEQQRVGCTRFEPQHPPVREPPLGERERFTVEPVRIVAVRRVDGPDRAR